MRFLNQTYACAFSAIQFFTLFLNSFHSVVPSGWGFLSGGLVAEGGRTAGFALVVGEFHEGRVPWLSRFEVAEGAFVTGMIVDGQS